MLASVQAVSAQAAPAAPASDPRINILGAWYGDLGAIQYVKAHAGSLDPWLDNARFCSATRAIRARCQGRPTCYQQQATAGAAPADGMTSELNGANLCGYEPAPFASAWNKGVIVSYECIALTADKWKSIGFGDPARHSATDVPDVQLRAGAIGEIRCQGAVTTP